MALRKVTPTPTPSTPVIADPNLTRVFTPEELQAIELMRQASPSVLQDALPPTEGVDTETGEIHEPTSPAEEVVEDASEYVEQAASANLEDRPLAPISQGNTALATQQTSLVTQNFDDLAFDWTSFPTISLKIEGTLVDIDNHDYGKEIFCRILGWKKRWVYRANPVTDNKRDVGFSYDQVTIQTGVSVAAKIAEWEAMGRTVEEREYLEVVVQMEAPEEPYDGEYRILSVSPTSKGRFAGYAQRAAQLGQGNTANVVTRVYVGDKITKVANPFYPWMFALHSIG